jgi:hypothetical protein
MSNKKIWFALVGVKLMEGNEYLTDADGAYVNAACLSENESEFIAKLHENFEHNKFKIFEIDDIETEETLSIDNEDNAEKLALMDEINEGYSFAWGTFHTFDKE